MSTPHAFSNQRHSANVSQYGPSPDTWTSDCYICGQRARWTIVVQLIGNIERPLHTTRVCDTHALPCD